MVNYQAELIALEKQDVDFADRAAQAGWKDGTTAGRKETGSQLTLHLILVASVGIAITFLIITCFRLTSTQRALQTQSWVRLASSKEGGDDDGMCPEWKLPEEAEQRQPQTDERGELMATGEGAHEGQGEPTEGVAGGGESCQQEESVGCEGERERKQFQDDPLGGAGGGAAPYQQGAPVGGAAGIGEQLEEHSLGGAEGGEAPQQQEELMGGSAEGGAQRQPVNSLGGAAGGKEPQPHEKPVGAGPRPGDIPEGKREKPMSTPAPGEETGGATAPEVLEESTSGGSGAGASCPPRKRKRKTKHTETATRPPLPPYRDPYLGLNAPCDSDEGEDDAPTYRWPTGLLYDIRGPTLEGPPPPAKRERILGQKMAKGDSQGDAKGKSMDKTKGGTKPESQCDEKKAKDQPSKVHALTQVVGQCVSYAEELDAVKGASMESAMWLLSAVSRSLTVQVFVARQTSQSGETEEVCSVAEAAVAAAREWIVKHGGTPTEVHLPGEAPVTEESRDSVSVRLLVLQLASSRLTEQLRQWKPRPSADYLHECEKLLKMAQALLAGTEHMLESLLREGQHAAAEVLTQALESFEDLTDEMQSVVTWNGTTKTFAVEIPTNPAVSVLDSLAAANTAADGLLASMAGGVDSSVRKIAVGQLDIWTQLLSSAEVVLGVEGVDGSLLQSCIDAALGLRERIDLIQATLSSTSTR
ncbi:hypothetical protein, conserved [Eimeria acervulina]|uniref:Uncharacterized protein n=1 Tax=Eimeria acervulina TaxID=5801 RepID=U6GBH1_EIMAC|nr:hypothetical protein, conserved [Eimeria acervulina]CDI76887.1 hypothetical protein, conserved [Eimeria acervulina]